MTQPAPSPLRLVAMYLNPLALPQEQAAPGASRTERRRVRLRNVLMLRPLYRGYIERSGNLALWCFVAFVVFSTLLRLTWLSVAAGIGLMVAILHTVVLIFLQQHANDLAARAGEKNPEIEERDDKG